MKLKFTYDMRIDFSIPVTRHFYSLKCLPPDTSRQHIEELHLEISPEAEQNLYTDSWKSKVVYGSIQEEHSFFKVKVSGTADTGLEIYEEFDEDTDVYMVPSAFTRAGDKLREFYDRLSGVAPEKPYERVTWWMNRLHEEMNYQSDSTDVSTTAEEAFSARLGVCQDYAHIFISLMRLDGIPARYVVGMMTGEGQSHAWVEVNLKGYWYGFDPTNNLLADSYYIKISHGRDYKDCIVSKGVFCGFALQTQTVSVVVEEVKPEEGETAPQ